MPNQLSISLLNTGQCLQSVDGDYVPVNKGHFELDTEERSRAFHEKLGRGWEEEYQEYRSCWEVLPRERRVCDYPILVDVELASSCNLACPMCYTTTDYFEQNVKRKLMKWDLFRKVVDEVVGNVYALRLSWRGESTLHRRFVDAVKYAKDRGIKEVSFLTNGSKLDLDLFKRLVDAGADWITVSFDGLGEEYNKVRKPLVYEETLEKLRAAMEYKRENGIEKPVIKVQGVWPAIRKDPEAYYKTMREVSDLVAFNPIIDYLGKDGDILYEESFSCPQLYERVFVSSTGEVMMCNSDEYGEQIIGDAWKQTIHEIWHGEKLTRMRELHAKPRGFLEVLICKRCYYPRKTHVDESAVVEGRIIHIENYINRRQEIGE